jgi:hypothetical protein
VVGVVCDQRAERVRIAIGAADRLVERDRGAALVARLRDLLRQPVQRAGELGGGRLAAEFGGSCVPAAGSRGP